VIAAEATMEEALWGRLLAFDEATHEYFAEREEWCGALVFTCRQCDVFNLALIRGAAAPDPEALTETIAAHYRQQGMTPRVRLTPLSRPEDCAERLRRRGFVAQQEASETFMVLREGRALTDAAGPPRPEVVVRRARSEEELAESAGVIWDVFGMPEELRAWGRDLARRDLGSEVQRSYTAFLGGEAVGAAAARMTDGITGIYGVATLARFRRRGVCATLVGHIVAAGRAEGNGTIYLSAQAGGYAEGLYARLGFERLFTVATYELPPGDR
jgi:ribosomal protein S18 acetylase RimI-like enzyme